MSIYTHSGEKPKKSIGLNIHILKTTVTINVILQIGLYIKRYLNWIFIFLENILNLHFCNMLKFAKGFKSFVKINNWSNMDIYDPDTKCQSNTTVGLKHWKSSHEQVRCGIHTQKHVSWKVWSTGSCTTDQKLSGMTHKCSAVFDQR